MQATEAVISDKVVAMYQKNAMEITPQHDSACWLSVAEGDRPQDTTHG